MSHPSNKPNRRDFLKTVGGVLGGVSLLGHGFARGQALGSMPNSYKFYRVLAASEGGRFGAIANPLGDMTGAVMMASPSSGTGLGYVFVRGVTNPKVQAPASPGVFAVVIDYNHTPPSVRTVWDVAIEGRLLLTFGKGITIGHIGTGACNALGEYVTTISPAERSETVTVTNSPGVYLFRPVGSVGSLLTGSRIIGFADPVPDGGFYGGDFGDVALDDEQNLLLAAATTQSPAGVSGFSGSQALIATSLGAPAIGRVVLQTGDMLPIAKAGIESVGLIDLAGNHAFAAQVTAKRLDPAVTRSGTALVVGNTQAGRLEHKLVAASSELISADLATHHNITSGHTFFGPRIDARQDVAFVTHTSEFHKSTGSNDAEKLGYYSRGSAHRLQQTRPMAAGNAVLALGAPCIDRTGLMYVTKLLGDGTTQLMISDGDNSEVVLESGDRVAGKVPDDELMITEILFGQHPTQVDAFGRLAFTAEFLLDPKRPHAPDNVITALVIGIPQ
jgi:hypothetical protein